MGIPTRNPRFSATIIKEALKVITEKKQGYSDELAKLLIEEVKGIRNTKDVEDLIRVLEILDYITHEFIEEDNNHKSIWKATDKAYRTAYSTWKYLFKTFFGKDK